MPSVSVIDPSTKATQATGRSILDLFTENSVWFTPAINDRQAGWGRMRLLLESGRVGVWKGKAPYLCHTLPKLARNPGKADDILDKQDDHGADALRYGLMEIRDGGFVMERGQERNVDEHRQDQVFERLTEQLRSGGGSDIFDGLGEGF